MDNLREWLALISVYRYVYITYSLGFLNSFIQCNELGVS